jgi:hypothetical protein
MMDIVDNIGKIEKNLLVTGELHNDSFFCCGAVLGFVCKPYHRH